MTKFKVEYVFYAGPIEKFVVKLKCGHYLKYTNDFNDFQNKFNTHEDSCES